MVPVLVVSADVVYAVVLFPVLIVNAFRGLLELNAGHAVAADAVSELANKVVIAKMANRIEILFFIVKTSFFLNFIMDGIFEKLHFGFTYHC